MNLSEHFFSIIIIRIDHQKWLFDQSADAQNRLSSSPRFFPVCRDTESLRYIRKLLECVCHRRNLLNPVPDHFFEVLLQIMTDHKDNPVKSSFQRVMDGVIHNDLPIRTHWLQLFDPSAKTASDSGCHNDKCCFFHLPSPRPYICCHLNIM